MVSFVRNGLFKLFRHM